MSLRGRLVSITIVLIATSCTPVERASDHPVLVDDFEGVWSWGSPRHSANVPFLRITRNDMEWIIQTKHYMYDYFVSTTKDVRISSNHLEFVYWYAPLNRWSKCSLDLLYNKMAGHCDGELNAQQWGTVPTFLWRSNN